MTEEHLWSDDIEREAREFCREIMKLCPRENPAIMIAALSHAMVFSMSNLGIEPSDVDRILVHIRTGVREISGATRGEIHHVRQ